MRLRCQAAADKGIILESAAGPLAEVTGDTGVLYLRGGLKVAGVTIVDSAGSIPYSVLSGTPSAVTWASLTGVPSSLLYGDSNLALTTGKTISVGGTIIVDGAGKIPYSNL